MEKQRHAATGFDAMIAAFALRYWPYIAGALAVIALLAFIYHRGAASRDGEVSDLRGQLAVALANTATLKAAIARQNAALADVERAKDATEKAAAKAVETGRKRERELAGVKGRLDALARSEGRCAEPVPDAVKEAWSKLS
jgi:chromosome segregation ATPase